ncbi:MAG: glycerophosphodiester phosphodiesterase family protein [Myxococcota bacterium]
MNPATRHARRRGLLALVVPVLVVGAACAGGPSDRRARDRPVQLGPRPYYLLDLLEPGPLRSKLDACRTHTFRPARFSIGHRGAPLQFPEHTRAAYRAAAVLGAGQLECDVAVTRDRVLVCRHAQCDLATTTNILSTALADRCRVPFEPATSERPARAVCCTQDFDFEELRSLEARMDAADRSATRPEAFSGATPSFRTDLYSTGQRLVSHAESLALFDALGADMTPELKGRAAEPIAEGDASLLPFADQLVDEVRAAGIPPTRVRLQSFDPDVIRHWIRTAPDFGAGAVWLVEPRPEILALDDAALTALRAEGFRTIAPPTTMLLTVDDEGRLGASAFAERLRAHGFAIIAWTLERSGRIRDGRVEGRSRDFYLAPVLPALRSDGDVFRVIHALHAEVGVEAIFSDWPAAVTYYANCLGLD